MSAFRVCEGFLDRILLINCCVRSLSRRWSESHMVNVATVTFIAFSGMRGWRRRLPVITTAGAATAINQRIHCWSGTRGGRRRLPVVTTALKRRWRSDMRGCCSRGLCVWRRGLPPAATKITTKSNCLQKLPSIFFVCRVHKFLPAMSVEKLQQLPRFDQPC